MSWIERHEKIRRSGMLTTGDLMDATGATFRQIDHWRRVGYLSARIASDGPGTVRGWDSADIPRAKALVAARGDRRLMQVIGKGEPRGPWVYEVNGVRVTVEMVEP